MWRLKAPLFPYKQPQQAADESEARALRTWLRERDRLMRDAEWSALISRKPSHHDHPQPHR